MSKTARSWSWTKRLSPGSTLRMPTWRTHCGSMAGAEPPISVSSLGSVPAQAGHAACRAGFRSGLSSRVLKSACASSQTTRSRRSVSRQRRATAAIEPMREAVIAAQAGSAGGRPQARGTPRRAPRGSTPPLRRDCGSPPTAGRPGIRRSAHIAAIPDVEPAPRERRDQPRDAQRLRTHRRAAIARAHVGRRADETRRRLAKHHAVSLARRARACDGARA